MVFDHVGWGWGVHTYIQSFHMPLFFIVSGFLWKPNDIITVVKKRFRTLIVPYGTFATVYFILNIVFILFGYTNKNITDLLVAICVYPTDMGNMPFAPALWFLPCMFLTELLYTTISNQIKTMKGKGIIVGTITLVGLVYSGFDLPILPWAIEPVTTAVFFWYVGEIIHINYKEISEFINHDLSLFIFICISVVLAFSNGCIDMRSARYCIAPLYLLNGILGTLTYWSIAYRWDTIKIFDKKLVGGFLQYLSVNAMAYLCMNQFFITICNKIFENLFPALLLAEIVRKILIFCFTLLLCTIMNVVIKRTRLKFVLGR